MRSPAAPPDEQSRLETLRSLGILDTPPEERFDSLTRTAKRMFGVPMALVSLVDENRQWFKSRVGLEVTETPREFSFCGHAILEEAPLVIPDALADERFADNPLVLGEPGIRFYAGCPLSAPDGRKLGTLCVLDREPRDFGQADIEALIDLAAIAEREIAVVEMATQDELTGIANRRGFMMLARQSLSLCDRQGVAASLVFMDLDDFKPVNDRFGHAEGDRALQRFAGQIKGVCREADVVARLGGDEFVVLLVNASRQDAEKTVARLWEAIEEDGRDAPREYELSFSHGTIEFKLGESRTIEDMLEEGIR